MSKHFFLKIAKCDREENRDETLQVFESAEEASGQLRSWLEEVCGLECYCGAEEEAALRAKNDGALPELAFACPVVENPADLQGYNGHYFYEYAGAVSLFVLAVYDEKSARRFRVEATKEYELDKTLSDEADEMIDMLEILERSFTETVDYGQALERVSSLIAMGGLSLF